MFVKTEGKIFRTVWGESEGDKLLVKMIDQTLLPHEFRIISLPVYKETAEAIKTMKVRGAGAIGAAAGFAMAQVVLEAYEQNFISDIEKGAEAIKKTRPTAQNLFYSIDRVLKSVQNLSPEDARKKAVEEANKIAEDDLSSCKKIGEYGAPLIKDGMRISTHCNAGWLAFVDYGSALSPIYVAQSQGKNIFVYVDETRPRVQGSLTSWELLNQGINHAIIADNSTGFLMQKKEIDLVIVGADRIAANGDVANKIGTYERAVLAKENGIPFYVAAPTTTFDLNCESGEKIPIEERSQDEVLFVSGKKEDGSLGKVRIAPEGARAKNLAFDVTPATYITGIITEKGIVKADKEEIAKLFSHLL